MMNRKEHTMYIPHINKISMCIIFLFSIITATVFAQAPNTLWLQTIGDASSNFGESVQPTRDGGFIVLGTTKTASGSSQFYLARTDGSGNTIWTQTYGGAGDDFAASVQQNWDGGFILTGSTRSGGNGESDLWLIRTDSLGNQIWERKFGTAGRDGGNQVIQTNDSGFAVIGSTEPSGNSDFNAWLVRVDSSGNLLWTRTFGGSDTTFGLSVQQTDDGGFIFAGTTRFFGNTDIWLVRTDDQGTMLWQNIMGSAESEFPGEVQQTSDGGFIVVGSTNDTPDLADDIWLIRIDASGSTIWSRFFGSAGSDHGESVQQTPDGGFIITGRTPSPSIQHDIDLWLIKTDPNGGLIWSNIYGGAEADYGRSVRNTGDGGYIVCGSTHSFGQGEYDFWLIRLESENPTGIPDGKPGVATDFRLEQNYPNPFNPATTIEFALPQKSKVRITVYNMNGEPVKTLINRNLPAGYHQALFDGSGLASGIYLYRIQAGEFSQVRKMMLIK